MPQETPKDLIEEKTEEAMFAIALVLTDWIKRVSNGEPYAHEAHAQVKSIIQDLLLAVQKAERERFGRLMRFLEHDDNCILNCFEAGEPTDDGGYRQKFAGEWYQASPVDETPKCNCGLDESLKSLGD